MDPIQVLRNFGTLMVVVNVCFVPTLGGSYELFTIFSFYSVEEVSKQTWRRKNSADVMKIAV